MPTIEQSQAVFHSKIENGELQPAPAADAAKSRWYSAAT